MADSAGVAAGSAAESSAEMATSADGLSQLDPSGYVHGSPTPGMECLCTMEDITEEDNNYCEFQSVPSMSWHPCLFSSDTVKQLILRQFDEWGLPITRARAVLQRAALLLAPAC